MHKVTKYKEICVEGHRKEMFVLKVTDNKVVCA